MPRRSLLSIEQRTRLFAIAVDHAEMAKHYVLSPDDLALIPVWFNNVERVAAARVGQNQCDLCATSTNITSPIS